MSTWCKFFILHQSGLNFFFFFNDTATTEIYTLSLHDALPISHTGTVVVMNPHNGEILAMASYPARIDRKSTRLNSSHGYISYAVFCLKKKKYRHHHNTLVRRTPKPRRRPRRRPPRSLARRRSS